LTSPDAAGGAAGPVSRLQAVTLPGPAGKLEGLLQEHDGRAPERVAVVCHPHPLYGGTLHNKVVHRVASVLHAANSAVLRFNFRGVGGSEGYHSDGVGELEDARAALRWIQERHANVPVWAAGFSFGSWIAARLAAAEPVIERLILVAPAVSRDFSVLEQATVPKLVVQGTNDDLCPPQDLERVYPRWAEPKTLIRIEGATHFFDRKLGELGDALVQGLGLSGGAR
jgi:alpha/beta superfamily hydrolase